MRNGTKSYAFFTVAEDLDLTSRLGWKRKTGPKVGTTSFRGKFAFVWPSMGILSAKRSVLDVGHQQRTSLKKVH
jgi:hypothetical protein